ncbi:MAG: serine hydrolase [Cyanobacteria bacterium J06635_10]
MRLSDKKRWTQLFRLPFLSAIVGVALTIISICLVLYKQQNTGERKQVAKKVNQSIPLAPVSRAPIRILLEEKNSYGNPSPINLSENIEQKKLAYNIAQPPKFIKSQKLQVIIDEVINLVKVKKLPLQPLSVTILNPKTGEYAGYKQKKLTYPASVVKLFWMVYLYAKIEQNILSEADFTQYLDSMIKKSDNEAASYIIDRFSQTQYQQNITDKEYKNWLEKRLKINQYFQQAGYDKINVSQKTFPIPSLKLSTAKGSELKMRGLPHLPILNKISTQQVARLLYEIYNRQSVSAIFSQKMAKLLTIDSTTRNLKKDDRNPNEFNPVRGFLSASLPNNIHFRGKAGWTSNSRNDAAIIATSDGKIAYILVVFAEDKAYAHNWKIFPQISRLVFERMTNPK